MDNSKEKLKDIRINYSPSKPFNYVIENKVTGVTKEVNINPSFSSDPTQAMLENNQQLENALKDFLSSTNPGE